MDLARFLFNSYKFIHRGGGGICARLDWIIVNFSLNFSLNYQCSCFFFSTFFLVAFSSSSYRFHGIIRAIFLVVTAQWNLGGPVGFGNRAALSGRGLSTANLLQNPVFINKSNWSLARWKIRSSRDVFFRFSGLFQCVRWRRRRTSWTRIVNFSTFFIFFLFFIFFVVYKLSASTHHHTVACSPHCDFINQNEGKMLDLYFISIYLVGYVILRVCLL